MKSVVNKPWGSFEIIDEGAKHTVKKIIVHPEGKLSLQSHKHRSEHWLIASGSAEVIIDNKNGITVDECAKVSRITEDVIKLDDEFKSEYTLEVTSPGINRPLFLENDYKDNIGSKVKVSLKKLQDKTKNISGIIMEVVDKFVVIKARNKSYKIEFENIKKANLDIEIQIKK